ncbi:MAG: exopolysaccharide biosynthesis polyprenyl glycosylphosphotransferase [Melioribacteraceae bacterium]|nr:exopolysaccharide biosynthesis polyprenyl glycosylphosphotransferase [Melioribacteraceae bacterium]
MNKYNKSEASFRITIDIILLNAAFFFSAISAQSLDILVSKPQMFFLQLLVTLIWLFSFLHDSKTDDFFVRKFSMQSLIIIRHILIITLFSISFIFFSKENLFTRNFILYFSASALILLLIFNFLHRKLLQRKNRKGRNLISLAIIGSGELAESFRSMLLENTQLGYRFAGFISTSEERMSENIGTLENFETTISKNKIDEVVIALPLSESNIIDRIIKICDIHAIKAYLLPDSIRYISNKFNVISFGQFPTLSVRNNPLDLFYYRFLKRSLDLILSFIVTIFILSWLIPIISLLIRIDSKGNPIFVQKRVGLNDVNFSCLKFRTMRQKSYSEEKMNRTVEDDERITKIGKFLRATNLDEIPQFLNVLVGQMSIVGPRPHALSFHNEYKEIVDEIKLRHRVKPGITGWAQIHGLRGDVEDPAMYRSNTKSRIEFDIWYIENWSLKLDVQILFETFWQIFSGKNKGI